MNMVSILPVDQEKKISHKNPLISRQSLIKRLCSVIACARAHDDFRNWQELRPIIHDQSI